VGGKRNRKSKGSLSSAERHSIRSIHKQLFSQKIWTRDGHAVPHHESHTKKQRGVSSPRLSEYLRWNGHDKTKTQLWELAFAKTRVCYARTYIFAYVVVPTLLHSAVHTVHTTTLLHTHAFHRLRLLRHARHRIMGLLAHVTLATIVKRGKDYNYHAM
jgi:hypothetical protein